MNNNCSYFGFTFYTSPFFLFLGHTHRVVSVAWCLGHTSTHQYTMSEHDWVERGKDGYKEKIKRREDSGSYDSIKESEGQGKLMMQSPQDTKSRWKEKTKR